MKSFKLIFFFFILACSTHEKKPKNYFEFCNHPETKGTTIPFEGKFGEHRFRKECAPDTLYSWKNQNKINWEDFDKNFLTKGLYLYTWRTPLGSYPYGDTQIRMKLKKDVKFKWIQRSLNEKKEFWCPQNDQDNTIYVITSVTNIVINEYLICSPHVVESWSTHSDEAYQEAKRELQYLKENVHKNPQAYDSGVMELNRRRPMIFNKRFSHDQFFMNLDNDRGIVWSDELIEKAVQLLKSPRGLVPGKIYGEHPERHFESSVPSYFNH